MEGSARLRTSLGRAREFIEHSRNPDGLWSDFLTLAGESVYWVSGYLGCALSRCDEVPGDELEELGSKILGCQGRDGGWGYGPGVPSDADSTSWCLLLLARLGAPSPERIQRALVFLLGHQSQIDGGFRTYAVPGLVGRYMMLDKSVSFEGWASSQTCVTGVAARALIESRSPRGVEEALDYIRKSQEPEGYWEPYWWSERLYSTVNCMEALNLRGGDPDSGPLSRAQNWIAGTQLEDGGWSDLSTPGGLPFSTALAVRGLLIPSGSDFSDEIRKGVEWLLAQQLTDGSWSAHHILRIPHPSEKEPWKQHQWRQDGRAINAVIRDHRRLYTTATALTALAAFGRRFPEVNGV